MSALRRPVLALCSLLLIQASCSSPMDVPVDPLEDPSAAAPARLDVASGDEQEGTVGTELPLPLTVQVVDSSGRPIPDIAVAWRVTGGGGSISPARASTDAQGASQARLTLGVVAGTHTVEATVERLAAVYFSATAKAGIEVEVQQPLVNARAGDTISVIVRVTSRYEIAAVVASVEDRQANLVAADRAWTGRLPLHGMARGPKTVQVTATDIHGNASATTRGFWYYRKPPITVISPQPYAVVRDGSVWARALCDDDNPACPIEVYVGGALQAQAQSGLDVTIPVSTHEGRPTNLQFRTRDSAGQPVSVDREIFVESSPRLREVATADGVVWDVDADRVLFLEFDGRLADLVLPGATPDVRALKLRGRSSAADVTVMDQPDMQPRYGFLTPHGAIFVATSVAAMPGSLYVWRERSLSGLGPLLPLDAQGSLVVSGPWAIWTQGRNLFRRDLLLGTNTTVATGVGIAGHDVASNGDVVYWSGAYRVFRYRNGSSTLLTGDSDPRNATEPVTDGVHVVYRRSSPCCGTPTRWIAMFGASGEERILSDHGIGLDQRPLPGRDYQANNGWIAYTKPEPAGGLQIWTRSPGGLERPVARVGADDRIEGLGPGGEVVFARGSRRFVSVPDYDAPPVEIGAAWLLAHRNVSNVVWRDGTLLMILGRSVFEVDY